MNSDRHKVQLLIESEIGSNSPEELSSKQGQFELYSISREKLPEFQRSLRMDTLAYLRKGICTLLQALGGLPNNLETWSYIKLYYSMYYLQRAILGSENIAFVRCRSIYTWEISIGSSPVRFNSRKFNGDHKATIRIFSDHYKDRNELLSQNIEDSEPLLWLSNKRDWINYKRREFIDGVGLDGFNVARFPYKDQIRNALRDDVPIFCFDPDIACLTYPIKFAQKAIIALDPEGDVLREELALSKNSFGNLELIEEFERNWEL